VVVVVADAVLVKGRRPGGLNAPDESLLDEDSKGVVHGLSRDGADVSANVRGDLVGRAVGPTRHRAQHGQALGRDLDAPFAKELDQIARHDDTLFRFWTMSRICPSPIYTYSGTRWPLPGALPDAVSVKSTEVSSGLFD
jgi:hypothetical protein